MIKKISNFKGFGEKMVQIQNEMKKKIENEVYKGKLIANTISQYENCIKSIKT